MKPTIEELQKQLDALQAQINAMFEDRNQRENKGLERPELAHGQIWRYKLKGTDYTAIQNHKGISLLDNDTSMPFSRSIGFDGCESSFTYIGMNPKAPKLFPEWITDRRPTSDDATTGGWLYSWREGDPHELIFFVHLSNIKLGTPWLPITAFDHCKPVLIKEVEG